MPKQELPHFEAGKQLTAAQLNQIVEAILRRMVGGAGVSITTLNGQVVVSRVADPNATILLVKLQIQSDAGDYLVCRSLDVQGNVGSVDINVMKPWTLGISPFDGLTVNGRSYTYSANGTRLADGSETQQITQDYFAGAVIYAARTEIIEEPVTNTFSDLLDMNADARQWCEPEA